MRWVKAEAQVATTKFPATSVLPEEISKRMLLLSIRGWIDTAPTLKRGNTTLAVDDTPDSALSPQPSPRPLTSSLDTATARCIVVCT
jgi:hypothetical protein